MAEANNVFRNQWSETLKQATRHHFEMWGVGLVKYIGNKDDRYAYDKSSLPFCKCEVPYRSLCKTNKSFCLH